MVNIHFASTLNLAFGGVLIFFACPSHLTIDHVPRLRRGTVPTPARETSNILANRGGGEGTGRVPTFSSSSPHACHKCTLRGLWVVAYCYATSTRQQTDRQTRGRRRNDEFEQCATKNGMRHNLHAQGSMYDIWVMAENTTT